MLQCSVLSRSVLSNSFQPHGLQPTRLLCPWGFSRQEYWKGLICSSPGYLPKPTIEPRSPTLQADSLPAESPDKCFLEGTSLSSQSTHPPNPYYSSNDLNILTYYCQPIKLAHQVPTKNSEAMIKTILTQERQMPWQEGYLLFLQQPEHLYLFLDRGVFSHTFPTAEVDAYLQESSEQISLWATSSKVSFYKKLKSINL